LVSASDDGHARSVQVQFDVPPPAPQAWADRMEMAWRA
jgi:hypothetical protein